MEADQIRLNLLALKAICGTQPAPSYRWSTICFGSPPPHPHNVYQKVLITLTLIWSSPKFEFGITLKNTSVQSKKHKQLGKRRSYKLARFLFPRLGKINHLHCYSAFLLPYCSSCLLLPTAACGRKTHSLILHNVLLCFLKTV